MPQRPKSLRAFLDALQASGRYTFTRVEAARALGLSDIALKNALWRQAQRLAVDSRWFGEGADVGSTAATRVTSGPVSTTNRAATVRAASIDIVLEDPSSSHRRMR